MMHEKKLEKPLINKELKTWLELVEKKQKKEYYENPCFRTIKCTKKRKTG